MTCPRPGERLGEIAAVVFDLDGVLIDSEHVWAEARNRLTQERGGRYSEQAELDMMGMSSPEWSRYMHEVVGISDPPDEINREVAGRLGAIYRERLPLVDGAFAAVERMAARWPLGLASSSNRELIDLVLELAGLDRFFAATVSSEEVARGKPAPDVYLEAARRLGVEPERCAAIEDSSPGVLSAAAAGMLVIAIPHPGYPLTDEARAAVDVELRSLAELDASVLAAT